MTRGTKWQLFDELTEEEFAALEKDCLKRGIMVPVEVTESGEILDGHNRFKIAKKHGLNYKTIVRKFKTDEEKQIHVLMLNMARRHLKPHQWGKRFKQLAEMKGVKRGAGRPKAEDNSPTLGELAEELGVSPKTAEKRLALADAYEELPAKEKEAVDCGEKSASSAARKQRQSSKRAEAAKTAVLEGKFSVVYADPPWQYGASSVTGGADQHYATMPTKEICGMPIPGCVTKDAVLFLWATNPLLPDALEVIASWGFSYKTNLVWVKDKATSGLGEYVRSQHELLLIATRGSMVPEKGDRPLSVISAERSKHSKKPDEVYELIESLYPKQRYVEIFARQSKEGWTSYGNEVDKASR